MTEPRHRVLFVGAFPPEGSRIIGGMVTSCRTLLQSSLPRMLDLDLLDSTQISNPPPIFIKRLYLAFFRFLRFIRALERRKPDAVMMFVAPGASVVEKGVMARYARLRGVPVVMFPRAGSIVDASNQSALTLTITRAAFRAASMLVCQSEQWQEFAIDALGMAPTSVMVLRNWTATPELLAIGEQRLKRLNPPVRLLYLGWLEAEKGVIELVEACAKLENVCDFTLNFVGDGAAAEQVKKLVSSYKLADRITLNGWKDAAQVHQHLAQSDVLVLPSWAEGLPNAMVEAMAVKLAVVATRVGAIPDVITDNVSGLLVPPKDPGALQAALTRVITEPEVRLQLAQRGFEIAQQEFNVSVAAERLYKMVDELVRR